MQGFVYQKWPEKSLFENLIFYLKKWLDLVVLWGGGGSFQRFKHMLDAAAAFMICCGVNLEP